jgi:hypothetical protein
MIGKRVDKAFIDYAPGDYGKDDKGNWVCSTPNGLLGTLTLHNVVEHPDGTISVTPSILVTVREHGQDKLVYYGYLTKGVWSDC